MLCGHGPCFWLGQKTLEEHTDCGIKDNVSSHCWQDGNLGFFVQLSVALTGSTGQPSTRLKPLSFLLSSVSWKTDYFFVWIFPPWDLEKLQHTRVNILDLKILQVFFKNRGEILVFEKMLNFLSFLVLLYVSGHSKQKKNFQNFLTV